MRDILILAIVGGFTVVAVGRPVVGILFFVWLGFFYPQSHAWGIAATIPLSQVVGIATIFGCFVAGQVKKFPADREAILLLGLWVMFGVSSLFAIYPERAAEKFAEMSKIFLMVFVTMLLLRDEERLRALLRVIALSLGFYGLKGGLFVILTGGQYLVYGPEESFLRANNSIGLALAMNVPLLYFLFRTETRLWLRWLIGTMLVFSYPAAIFTYSRGAWLGLAAGTALLILKMRHKFLFVAGAGAMSVILIGTFPQLIPQRLSDRYDVLVNYEEDPSAESRFWSWEFCKRVGMARPLIGGGFKFYSLENYAKYYPEFLERWRGKEWSCHSAWLTVFSEHGFPGFLLWISLLISSFLSLRQVRAYATAHAEITWLALYAEGIQGALVVYLIVGTFLDAAYFDMVYYLVAMVIIAKEIVRVAYRTDVLTASTPVLGARVPARALTR